MPRRSSGRSAPRLARRPAPRAAPRPAPRAAPRPAPAPAYHAPPPAPMQSSGSGSMLGAIARGMLFGTGSAVAHRAVDAVMGPRTIQHETVASEVPAAAAAPTTIGAGSDACSMHSKAFQDCINSSESDISKCQFYMDMLSECRRNSMLNA